MVMDDIFDNLSPLALSPNCFSPFHNSFSQISDSLSSNHSAPNPNSLSPTNGEPSEDPNEFSDIVLTYINQMLMEENDSFETFPDDPTIVLAQQPFLDIIQSTTPPQFDQSPSISSNSEQFVAQIQNPSNFTPNYEANNIDEETQNPSNFSSSSETNNIDNEEHQNHSNLSSTHETNNINKDKIQNPSNLASNKEINIVDNEHNETPCNKGRKRDDDNIDPEDKRCAKNSALCTEEAVRHLFDKVLLCRNDSCDFKPPLENNPKDSQTPQGNKRGRKKGGSQIKDEAVDLTTLLIHCAQCVAIDDQRGANQFLKEIRKHASPYGDATQRLAVSFADGLEARLGGTGSDIYRSLVTKKSFTCDILKAYQLYLTSCPFKKVSHYFSDVAILDAVQDCKKLHIVDYGIYYGFQWPCFMQRLARRPNGPPRLRITGIDLPQSGFRPSEMVEQTGLRLAEYAKLFNVPFEYHAIAAKWETIRVSDLNIDRDEVLVVNCLYRLRNIADETVSADNPRIRVLNTIRRMNPRVFVHGILHGSFGVPFFMTRFREALFHFSTLFDMIEATTSRVDEHRLLIERDLFGREALNVIACEGIKRIERPESYKQWQVKNLRAGFKQVPLRNEVVQKARSKVKKCYHRDFVVDQDNGWLLQGWKGRVIFAISAWKPNEW